MEKRGIDRDAFDGLTKLLAPAPSRRSALGTIFDAGLAGSFASVDAKKDRKRRKPNTKGKPELTAQAADCANPGPSANIAGCHYQDGGFAGDDLSGAKMAGTNFRNAELAGTNLSSSNARNAVFREANLACANLRSSVLGGADFRAADLTRANLKSSSGCTSAQFNAATTFCATTMCDGSIRNDDCPGGPPAGSCCDRTSNGGACAADGECCSGNCFNRVCADLVGNCGGTTCTPPASGCAGTACCGGGATFACGTTCCAPPATFCCGTTCCASPATTCCGSLCC